MAANYVKFLRGTFEAYKAAVKNPDTLYFVYGTDEKYGKLYLGEREIVSRVIDADLITTLANLKDVDVSGVINGQVLGWDQGTGKWIPMSLPEAQEISVMTGGTEEVDGAAGLVPAPKAGDQNKFLRGDGYWIEGYSKSEVDDIISGLNSLSRKKVNSKDDIDVNAEDADKYIYIASVGEGGAEGNQYLEYIVIEGKVEQIGSIGTGTGEVNIINSVDETVFEISNDGNKTLLLKNVPVGKISDFASHESFVLLSNKVDTLENNVGILQTNVGVLQNDVGTLLSDITILKSDVGSLNNNFNIIREEINSLKADTQELKNNTTWGEIE